MKCPLLASLTDAQLFDHHDFVTGRLPALFYAGRVTFEFLVNVQSLAVEEFARRGIPT